MYTWFASHSRDVSERKRSLAIVSSLLDQQKVKFSRFLSDDRVPAPIKARLASMVVEIMDENKCIELIKRAHAARASESEPNRRPKFLVSLQEIDPLLVDQFEDIVGEGLFAMLWYSKKVNHCMKELVGDVANSEGRRRIINASSPSFERRSADSTYGLLPA
jgi:hypothetical protein